MNSDGKIWKEELSERDYISNVLLKIAKEMGWEERIKKASTFPKKNHIDLWYDKEHDVFEYTDERNFIIGSSLRELLEKVYFDL